MAMQKHINWQEGTKAAAATFYYLPSIKELAYLINAEIGRGWQVTSIDVNKPEWSETEGYVHIKFTKA